MIFRSIRFKILLWYMLVLCLTFFLFGLVLYHTVNRRLNNDVNELLSSKAEGIKDSIESYWKAEELDLVEAGVIQGSLAKRHNLNFGKIVQRWLLEKKNEPLLLNVDVRIFDAGGRLIAAATNLSGLSSVAGRLSPADLGRPDRYEDLTVERSAGHSAKIRSLISPQWENQQVAYWVVVFSPLAPLMASLSHLKIMLFLLFPFILILSGLIGTFLARVTLHPVNRMMNTIQRITAENMRLRVLIPDTKDELKRLADTFNGMLDRLEGAFTSQRQFIEDLTHGLKTPLAVLKGELEVTLKKMRSAEDYESILRSSLEEVNRITKISENLLMLARYDNDKLALEKSPLDIGELVKEALDQLTVPRRQKDIALRLSEDGRLLVAGDRGKLRHLFLNILDNALKYTPAGGTISVDVRREQRWAKISISDTGVGISESELARVFDRFFRGEKENEQGGFGLGLSIAKAVAEAHLGKIEVTSTLHKGTTFSVFLPVI